MAYIRHKVIKGHVYYYLVEGRREGERVRQKVLKYLGKQGALNSSSGVGYRGLPQSETDNSQSHEARLRIRFKKTFKAMGFTVRHNLSGRTATRGKVNITRNSNGEIIRRSVSFTKNPEIGTMCHELGHVIDYHLRDKSASFWNSETFIKNCEAIREEFERVGRHKYCASLKDDPDRTHDSFFQHYVFTDVEGYANAFELFLTDYKKAMNVVPNMVAVFHDLIRQDDTIRAQIEALDVWKLEDEK